MIVIAVTIAIVYSTLIGAKALLTGLKKTVMAVTALFFLFFFVKK